MSRGVGSGLGLCVAAVLVAAVALAGVAITVAGAAESTPPSAVRFSVVAVMLTTDKPIAAYEVELVVRAGESTMVGVEGGEAPLSEPPYYDARALAGGRIILAAFSTGAVLPAGTHQVAAVHVAETTAEVTYDVSLRAVADPEGRSVEATAVVKRQHTGE